MKVSRRILLILFSVIMAVICTATFPFSALAGGTETRASIVRIAAAQVGKPYSMDTDKRLGPNYFDCSGLVWYCYANSGVIVDNTMLDWVAYPISFGDLLPGDLLYVNYYTRPGYPYPTGDHVGIYIGNGEVVHAKGTSYGVVREPVSNGNWTWAGRIPAGNWPDGDNSCAYAVQFGGVSKLPAMVPSQSYPIKANVMNKGTMTWKATGLDATYLSYYWVDNATGKKIIPRATPRLVFPQNVPYHGSAVAAGEVIAPSIPGSYTLRFDMVHNGQGYFSDRYCPTMDKPVTVMAAPVFNDERAITVSPSSLASIPDGPALQARPGTLLKGCASAAVYVTDYVNKTCVKRPFPDAGVFEGLGYHWEDIVTVPEAEVARFASDPRGPMAAGYHSGGALLKTTTSSCVFYVFNNRKYYVTYNSFMSNKFRWDRVDTVTETELSLYPDAGPWPLPDGTPIKGSGSAVYITDHAGETAVKRPVSSATVYIGMGFSWADLALLPAAELPAVTGQPLTVPTQLINGRLIRQGAHDSLFLLEGGTKRRLVASYGYIDGFDIAGETGLASDSSNSMVVGSTINVPVSVRNTGILPWDLSGNGGVEISYHWIDMSSGLPVIDDNTTIRSQFAAATGYQGLATAGASVAAPLVAGTYLLQWDLVQVTATGLNWFSANGAVTATIVTRVHPGYPDGTLVKAGDSPGVYYLQDGRKRPVSLAAFVSRGYRWPDIISISAGEMNGYAIADPLEIRAGTAIKGSGPAVYLVDLTGGVTGRRAVPSGSILLAQGYTWSDIISVADAELNRYRSIGSIGATDLVDGALVKTASAASVYVIGDGKRRPLTATSFAENGFQWGKIRVIGDTAMGGLPIGQSWPLPAGTLVKTSNSGAVYAIAADGDFAERLAISSAVVFEAMGYAWPSIITVSGAELNAYPAGSSL